MAARKKKAVARRKTTAMTTWEEELAQEAQQEKEEVGSGAATENISIRGGRFKYGDETLGNELDVIVVAHSFSREYYDSQFDPESPGTPACFAYSKTNIDKVASPDERSPNRQSDSCVDCEQNEWGSSGFGNSKACGVKVHMLVADPSGLNDEEYVPLKLRAGVNSLLNFRGYIDGLTSRVKRPCYSVVTNISFDEESDNPILKFKMTEPLDRDTIVLSKEMKEVHQGKLMELSFDPANYEAPVAKKRTAKKKTAKRKSKLAR